MSPCWHWYGKHRIISNRLPSPQEIEDQGFESTIQVGPIEECEDELDDEAIERSIAEINEAIRRSAQRQKAKT
jgi:hypothetical protein